MLMMMMMTKKKKGSLAVISLLVASVGCVINPSKEHLSGEFSSIPAHKQSPNHASTPKVVPLQALGQILKEMDHCYTKEGQIYSYQC